MNRLFSFFQVKLRLHKVYNKLTSPSQSCDNLAVQLYCKLGFYYHTDYIFSDDFEKRDVFFFYY